jgi:hypothetical protein
MKMMSAVLVSLSLVCSPVQAALQRTAPTAKSTAVASWWKRTIKIHYANGKWEYGYYRWWGLADSMVSPTVWILLNGSTQQASWALIGARIEVIGVPYPG